MTSALVLCLAALLPWPARADITRPAQTGNAPAVGPMTVRAIRGKPVEITLSGITATAHTIEFILRKQPKLGRLDETAPKSTSKSTAVVHYTATPGLTGNKDEFSFAVQVPGSSVSDSATVTILISDAAPKLDAPPLVDALRVVMGRPFSRVFNIRNAGNAPWATKVPAPKGWRWKNPRGGDFHLAPNEDVRCEIICEALAPDSLDETIALDANTTTRFVARIVPPFTLLPTRLTLKWNGESRTREGKVEIQNLDTHPLTVSLRGPDWVKLPASLALEADAKGLLTLTAEGQNDQTLAGAIHIAAGAYTQQVAVNCPPAPPLLAFVAGVTNHGQVAFGKLDAASLKTAKRAVTVRNVGGTEAVVAVQGLKMFRLETPVPATGLRLAPGAEAGFVILPPDDVAGRPAEDFVVTADGSRAEAHLSAGIDADALPVGPGAGSTTELLKGEKQTTGQRQARTRSEIEKAALANIKGLLISDGNEDPALPRINVVEVVEDTGDSMTIAWDLPEGDGWKFQLYRATHQRLENGKPPMKVWELCGKEVTMTIEGRKATATIKNLTPYVWYKCCLQTLAPDGRRSMPGNEIGLLPVPPPPTHWEWYVVGAVLLVILIYWLRKKWLEPISAAGT